MSSVLPPFILRGITVSPCVVGSVRLCKRTPPPGGSRSRPKARITDFEAGVFTACRHSLPGLPCTAASLRRQVLADDEAVTHAAGSHPPKPRWGCPPTAKGGPTTLSGGRDIPTVSMVGISLPDIGARPARQREDAIDCRRRPPDPFPHLRWRHSAGWAGRTIMSRHCAASRSPSRRGRLHDPPAASHRRRRGPLPPTPDDGADTAMRVVRRGAGRHAHPRCVDGLGPATTPRVSQFLLIMFRRRPRRRGRPGFLAG